VPWRRAERQLVPVGVPRSAVSRGAPRGVYINETWVTGYKSMRVPGCTRFGRNRTRVKEGGRPSGEVGMLICSRILKGATPPIVTRPTFGDSEGLLIVVKIEKRNKTLTILAVYNEFDRPGFPIDEKAFFTAFFVRCPKRLSLKGPGRKKIALFVFMLTPTFVLAMSRKERRV
jgi:hypothetical protein